MKLKRHLSQNSWITHIKFVHLEGWLFHFKKELGDTLFIALDVMINISRNPQFEKCTSCKVQSSLSRPREKHWIRVKAFHWHLNRPAASKRACNFKQTSFNPLLIIVIFIFKWLGLIFVIQSLLTNRCLAQKKTAICKTNLMNAIADGIMIVTMTMMMMMMTRMENRPRAFVSSCNPRGARSTPHRGCGRSSWRSGRSPWSSIWKKTISKELKKKHDINHWGGSEVFWKGKSFVGYQISLSVGSRE